MTRSAEIRTAREEWRRHWPLVAATTAAMSLAALPSFMLGTMIAPIAQEFGWTRTQITSGRFRGQ